MYCWACVGGRRVRGWSGAAVLRNGGPRDMRTVRSGNQSDRASQGERVYDAWKREVRKGGKKVVEQFYFAANQHTFIRTTIITNLQSCLTLIR